MFQNAREFLDSVDFLPYIRNYNYGIGISRFEFFASIWSDLYNDWLDANPDLDSRYYPSFSNTALQSYLVHRYGDGNHISSICKDERDQFQKEENTAFEFLDKIDFIPYFEKYYELDYLSFNHNVFDDVFALFNESVDKLSYYDFDEWKLVNYLRSRYGDYYFNHVTVKKVMNNAGT